MLKSNKLNRVVIDQVMTTYIHVIHVRITRTLINFSLGTGALTDDYLFYPLIDKYWVNTDTPELLVYWVNTDPPRD